MIDRTHIFLKTSLRKLSCNYNTDWNEIAYKAAMGYDVFPHSSTAETPLHLMFGYDTFGTTLFELLPPKLRYMDDKKF